MSVDEDEIDHGASPVSSGRISDGLHEVADDWWRIANTAESNVCGVDAVSETQVVWVVFDMVRDYMGRFSPRHERPFICV